MQKAYKFISVLLALVLLVTAPAFAQEDNHLKKIKESGDAAFFNLVLDDVVQMYQFDVQTEEIFRRTVTNLLNDNPELLDAFFRALFASFDDYSEFYTADEYAEMLDDLEGVTGGIGVQIEKGPAYVRVVAVLPDMPAAKAGIMVGDDILSVDGENMEGKSLDYVTYRLRGEIGTNVLVTILRNGEQFEYVLTRGKISNKTVSAGIISADVGYLAIHSFASATAGEVQEALKLFDERKIKKLIIDLRDNGGGYVDSAIAIARMFVPAGTIIQHYMRVNKTTMDYKSYLKNTKYSIVTLVNENTASASEILASALQESGASKLVGKKTFGKAVTQSVFRLYADRSCKLTTGEYYTRMGNKINNIGITPDFVVVNKKVRMEKTNAERLTYQTKYPIGESNEALSAYKQRLQYMDYAVGALDDEYTEDFKNAVYAYQVNNGIAPTGELDLITQIHITNISDDVEVYIDNQLAKAIELHGSVYTGILEK